jgi:hypothetical protein
MTPLSTFASLSIPSLFLFLPCVLCVKIRAPHRPTKSLGSLLGVALLSSFAAVIAYSASPQPAARSYLGFDLNRYPGDDAMTAFRKDFAFTGYWLSAAPREKSNPWHGKREFLRSQGYGFLPLFLAPDSSRLKNNALAANRSALDAKKAADSAIAEGFSAGTIIFLDIEEGGRLPPSYHTYLKSFSEELAKTGMKPGVYCSGMPVKEEPGVTITTADDIHNDSATRDFAFWIYNDACPPSPGCTAKQTPLPSDGGISYAAVWQFAQSPRRKEFTAHCPAKYAPDGNCYAPSDTSHKWFLDLNAATSPDPSSPSSRASQGK